MLELLLLLWAVAAVLLQSLTAGVSFWGSDGDLALAHHGQDLVADNYPLRFTVSPLPPKGDGLYLISLVSKLCIRTRSLGVGTEPVGGRYRSGDDRLSRSSLRRISTPGGMA